MSSRPLSALLLATLVLTGCPTSRPPDPWKANRGVYTTRLGSADNQERIVTLWLDEDGTARFETVYVGKERDPLEVGRWSAVGTEITVQLSPTKDPLVFNRVGRELLPVSWDHARFGQLGLTLQQRWPPAPSVP